METPNSKEEALNRDWEKWRNEQVETISNILSHVFKAEDAARQTKTPLKLFSGSISQSESEEEVRQKLELIRKQLSEYEQMVQIGLRRIDRALQIIPPPKAIPKNWLKRWIKRLTHK